LNNKKGGKLVSRYDILTYFGCFGS
jgi:hypothetical protein